MAKNDDPPALIGTAESELEANVWRDILKNDGIRAFVKVKSPLAVLGGSPLLATYEVFVQAGDEQRARWLLGDQDTSEY